MRSTDLSDTTSQRTVRSLYLKKRNATFENTSIVVRCAQQDCDEYAVFLECGEKEGALDALIDVVSTSSMLTGLPWEFPSWDNGPANY